MRSFLILLLGLALAATSRADQIELVDGSLVKGRIIAVESGKIQIETTFVGTISIALENVRSFATNDAVNVSMAGSPVVLARVYAGDENVRLQGDTVRLAAVPTQVTALWREGEESPAQKVARLAAQKARRKWSYEASAAVSGRTGASEKFNASLGMKATLESDRDRLILSGTVDQAESADVKTADREFLGADYSNFYSPDHGWYGRSSLEIDKIKAIDLRSTSAFGVTRKLVRKSSLNLEGRAGASYVLEDYSTGEKFNSPGLDITFLNTYTKYGSKLSTVISYLPSFRDFANYRVKHESSLELPLSVSLWKLKIGLANDYQSVPAVGVAKLDTTYFTSLLLNWK